MELFKTLIVVWICSGYFDDWDRFLHPLQPSWWDLGREDGLFSDLEIDSVAENAGKPLYNAFVTIGVFGPWNAWQRQSTLSLDRLFLYQRV